MTNNTNARTAELAELNNKLVYFRRIQRAALRPEHARIYAAECNRVIERIETLIAGR